MNAQSGEAHTRRRHPRTLLTHILDLLPIEINTFFGNDSPAINENYGWQRIFQTGDGYCDIYVITPLNSIIILPWFENIVQ